MTLLLNHAAANFEAGARLGTLWPYTDELSLGRYSECISDCEKAIEVGRAAHAEYKLIAKYVLGPPTLLALTDLIGPSSV
jgi:hypothetical protein